MVISVMFPFNGGWYSKLSVIITSLIQVLYKTTIIFKGYVLGPQNAIQYTVWIMFTFQWSLI